MNRIQDLEGVLETKWVVITGAPSSGKTTIVSKLAALGHAVCEDPARQVITESSSISPALSEEEKQNLIIDRFCAAYNSMDPEILHFLDYGMPDNLVFQEMFGVRSDLTERLSRLIRFKAVFILEPLPFEYDDVRDRDAESQREIHELMLKTYSSLGYNPVVLPTSSIEERIRVINDNIKGMT